MKYFRGRHEWRVIIDIERFTQLRRVVLTTEWRKGQPVKDLTGT